VVAIFLCLTAANSLSAAVPEEGRTARAAYKALSALTTPERKLLYAQLPSAMKAALWRLQIQNFVAQHPDLSTEQLALLAAANELLDATLFEIDPAAPEWKDSVDAPLTLLSEKAAVLFQHDEAVTLFNHLGDPEPPTEAANDRALGSEQGVPPSPHDDCECSKRSDWCWSGSFCNNTYPTCRVVGFGCGTFFTYTCDGLCVSPPG
jgi:hypothetical protein